MSYHGFALWEEERKQRCGHFDRTAPSYSDTETLVSNRGEPRYCSRSTPGTEPSDRCLLLDWKVRSTDRPAGFRPMSLGPRKPGLDSLAN